MGRCAAMLGEDVAFHVPYCDAGWHFGIEIQSRACCGFSTIDDGGAIGIGITTGQKLFVKHWVHGKCCCCCCLALQRPHDSDDSVN